MEPNLEFNNASNKKNVESNYFNYYILIILFIAICVIIYFGINKINHGSEDELTKKIKEFHIKQNQLLTSDLKA